MYAAVRHMFIPGFGIVINMAEGMVFDFINRHTHIQGFHNKNISSRRSRHLAIIAQNRRRV